MKYLIILLLFVVNIATSQSIAINNDGRYIIEMSEEEKAIKTSAGLIKAKTDVTWETNINNIRISWKIAYNKDTKLYLLYKHNAKYYESSTIAGVKSKYASDLLGREIKIQ
jgi:hypothetical protein